MKFKMILNSPDKNIKKVIEELFPAYKKIDEPIILTDKLGEIFFYNSNAVKIVGKELENGININTCLPNLSKTSLKKIMEKCDSLGETQHVQLQTGEKNKSSKKIQVNISPIKHTEAGIIGFLFLLKSSNDLQNLIEIKPAILHALHSIDEIIIITDITQKIVSINKSAEKKLGYSTDELIGKNIETLVGSKIVKQLNSIEQPAVDNKIWEGETYLISKSGETLPVEMTFSKINHDLSDSSYSFLITAIDISVRKETEKKLYESERKFRSLFENASLGMYRSDKNGKMLIANPQLLSILGVDSIEQLNNYDGYVEPTVREKLRKILETEGTIYGFETAWKKPDGKVIYIRESSRAFWDENGLLSYYEGTVEDITDRVLAEIKVQRHAKILSALKSISEILLKPINWESQLNDVCNVLGNALKIDRVRIFEHRKDSVTGDVLFRKKAEWIQSGTASDIVDEVNFTKIGLENWVDTLKENKIVNKNVDSALQREKEFMVNYGIVSLLIVPIFVNGEFWGGIGMHDSAVKREWTNTEEEALRTAAESISASIQRLNYEDRLIEALNEAEKSVRLKSEFLAQISHEIRTPINNILNFISLIKLQLGENLDEDLNTSFKIINRASDRLIRTIDLILNMSELQTGSYKPKKEMFDIYSEILEKLYLENKYKAKELGIEFKLSRETDETYIYADKYSVEQIFINLLDNAFKFTPEGKIIITIQKEEKNLTVHVLDTGIGISEEFLPDLFHPFRQEEQGYTRSFEGSGLGLSLVKEYCDLNEAEIVVESSKGGGTKFTVKFPTDQK